MEKEQHRECKGGGTLVVRVQLIDSIDDEAVYQTGDKSNSRFEQERDGLQMDKNLKDWISSLPFKTQIAFLNERDMVKYHFEAFAPAIVKSEKHCMREGVFLTVSSSSVQSGCIYLYREGILDQLCITKCDDLKVSVENISAISPIKKILLKPIDSTIIKDDLLERRLEKNFRMSSLGSPHVLNKQQSFSIKCLDQSITTCVTAIKFNDKENLESNDSINSLPKSLKHEDVNDVDAINEKMDNLSILDYSTSNTPETKSTATDCSIIDTSFENFQTSTPMKLSANDSNKSSKRSERKRKKGNKNISMSQNNASSLSCGDNSSSYFKIDADTEITIENVNPILSSSLDFDDINYYCDSSYESLKKLVRRRLCCNYSEAPINLNGLLLTGLPGTGEKLAVINLCKELEINYVLLSINEWAKSDMIEGDFFEEVIRRARQSAPSIILLEEIDTMCPPQTVVKGNDDELSAQILRLFNKAKMWVEPILLVATCFDSSPTHLLHPGKLEKELVFSLPKPEERARIIDKLIQSLPHSITMDDVGILSREALGFSGADLACALRGAWYQCVQRSKIYTAVSTKLGDLSLTFEDFREAINNVVPPFMRHKLTSVSKVEWSDVFGYSNIKLKLKLLIDRHAQNPVENLLKGFLFYGPPGCSKTMLVRALVKETNFSFFPVKCSDLLSKYVGETEKRLSNVFSIALKAAPSLIFMDEIDSLCQERSKGSGGSGMLSELLVLMEQMSKKNIMVIGATNRPQVLDEALFSPGCLEIIVHVDLPSVDDRCAIWDGLLNDVPTEEICIKKLASMSSGMSGAEIYSAYKYAVQLLSNSDEIPTLTESHLISALSVVQPRTSASMLNSIQRFTNGRKGNRLGDKE